FFGRIDSLEKLAEIYRKASVIVLPSSFESFGMAVLEGALFGDIPVVSDVVTRNFRGHPLGTSKSLYVIRQKTELPSMLNELLSSPKALKKGCLSLRQVKKAKKGFVRMGFAGLLSRADLLEKF
ncbi:glycosyltransferase, partial [Thermococcus sp. GR7]|uniref:glycosyltransferase n=1 Tax=Thermococcus sp. GR7 TaxID=1638257 RepID=UPI00143044EB